MSTSPRRTAVRRRAGARPAVLLGSALVAAALALPVGCAAPGELRDHGAVAPVTPSPARVPLWPGAPTAASPTPVEPTGSRSPEPPPQPVPDLTVPGQDITAVDVRALVGKDPGVTQDERRVLEPCAGCELRAPEYRDLTGDGRPELLLAVGLADTVVLHVYTASGERLLPIHRVSLVKGFGAETVGTDLWLYEPTASFRTGRLYHWDGVRLALTDQKVEGIGPTQEPEPTPSVAEKPVVEKPPAPRPSAGNGDLSLKTVPTARPSGPQTPASDAAVGKQPLPAPVRPGPPTATPLPETKP
ncbi:hypothetical protein SAMN05216371_2445 [Streptomyces sp. TLI_053]|uniref:hypothetical protein n=1 Tax=Streptomyces sp. TLI_053 TaxID=1855352 RepID=UPI00087CD401|nr:hypothetical protein [Streptomyces sp. TLI_053]SDT47564.1 hypothetical protein SAMN05216371_2445 [Streptomyces sp. TLI_053]